MSGTYSGTVYFTDFPATGPASVLGDEWGVYDSVGNAGNGFRKPAQVSVVAEATDSTNGKVLQIVAQNVSGQHWSGGLQLNVPRTYGEFEFRVRVSDDASQVTSGVVLLWPQSGLWPKDGEIDWWESFGHRDTRTPVETFVHRLNPAATLPYDNADDQLVVEYHHVGVDQSDWHTLVCRWAPDELSMSIDGGAFISLTTDPANIPDWPMQVALQLDAWSSTPPATPVVMQVGYVAIRAWSPGGSMAPAPTQPTRAITLVGADGTRHSLAAAGPPTGLEPYQIGVNSQLWGLAPYSVTGRQLGAIPGERVERVRALPRDVLIPIQVEGGTELEVDQRLGALGSILSPTAEVQVIYRRPDGSERELTGRAVSGMERIQATDQSGFRQRHVRVPLVVRAHYPYWRDTGASIGVTGPTTFADGMAGLSNVIDVTNAGDVDTWPEIIITGLANGADMLNMTTGQVLRITERIESGQTCRIDTDPRTRSVVINDVWKWPVDAASEFWPLAPGLNRLVFRTWSDFPATTPAIGTFTIRWRANYETC